MAAATRAATPPMTGAKRTRVIAKTTAAERLTVLSILCSSTASTQQKRGGLLRTRLQREELVMRSLELEAHAYAED
jgi:hypothetical protein